MKKAKIKIKLKSYDAKLLDDSAKKLAEAAIASGAEIYGPLPLPTRKEIFTVLRSMHVNKKSRQQYELRTHKRLIGIINSTPNTIQELNKIQLPIGILLEIKT